MKSHVFLLDAELAGIGDGLDEKDREREESDTQVLGYYVPFGAMHIFPLLLTLKNCYDTVGN